MNVRKVTYFLQLDPSNGHFMPSKMTVFVGMSRDHMVEQRSITVPRTANNVLVLSEQLTYHRFVQIHVLKCHESGINCRVSVYIHPAFCFSNNDA